VFDREAGTVSAIEKRGNGQQPCGDRVCVNVKFITSLTKQLTVASEWRHAAPEVAVHLPRSKPLCGARCTVPAEEGARWWVTLSIKGSTCCLCC
jgi:hypothetical protein